MGRLLGRRPSRSSRLGRGPSLPLPQRGEQHVHPRDRGKRAGGIHVPGRERGLGRLQRRRSARSLPRLLRAGLLRVPDPADAHRPRSSLDADPEPQLRGRDRPARGFEQPGRQRPRLPGRMARLQQRPPAGPLRRQRFWARGLPQRPVAKRRRHVHERRARGETRLRHELWTTTPTRTSLSSAAASGAASRSRTPSS